MPLGVMSVALFWRLVRSRIFGSLRVPIRVPKSKTNYAFGAALTWQEHSEYLGVVTYRCFRAPWGVFGDTLSRGRCYVDFQGQPPHPIWGRRHEDAPLE